MSTEPSEIGGWLPLLLQTSDALFPTGAYAHSLGLEEMVRLNVVHHEVTLRQFLTEHLLPTLQLQELPYLRFAVEAASDLDALCVVDREMNTWKLSKETREASIQIGCRRIKALRAISAAPLLLAFEQQVQAGLAFGHHLSACAIQAVTQGIPLEAALTTYAYQTLAGACAAALKLIRIGQDGCQRVLAFATQQLSSVVNASYRVERHVAGCFSPLLEIASMRHAYANERLFIS